MAMIVQSSVDDWTEEKCLQLIREFRARPILWDPKDPLFFKRNKKPKAWREIGERINVSADKCKQKMIILMSSFRREKAKIVHSIRETSDPSQAYKSSWFAFKDLAFLLDKDNERKRRLLNISDDDEDEDSTVKTLPMKKFRRHPYTYEKEVMQKVIDAMQDDDLSPSDAMPGPSQTQAEREEEIKSFTRFIGNKMKKYSDATKNAVQQAVCEVIFKADQNHYEPHCFEKFTIIDDDDPLNRAIYDQHTNTVIKVQRDSENSE